MNFGPGSRPAASNQIPGQIISSFTHFGPAAPQILRGEPKQRIRANFLTAPFEHYHFGNPYAGQYNIPIFSCEKLSWNWILNKYSMYLQVT